MNSIEIFYIGLKGWVTSWNPGCYWCSLVFLAQCMFGALWSSWGKYSERSGRITEEYDALKYRIEKERKSMDVNHIRVYETYKDGAATRRQYDTWCRQNRHRWKWEVSEYEYREQLRKQGKWNPWTAWFPFE